MIKQFVPNTIPPQRDRLADALMQKMISQLQQMLSSINCRICYEQYIYSNPPVQYTCFHTVCRQCQRQQSSIKKKHECPICRQCSEKIGDNYALIDCLLQFNSRIYSMPKMVYDMVKGSTEKFQQIADKYEGLPNIQGILCLQKEDLHNLIYYCGVDLNVLYHLNQIQRKEPHQAPLYMAALQEHNLVNIDENSEHILASLYDPDFQPTYVPAKYEIYDDLAAHITDNDLNTQCTAHAFYDGKWRVYLNLSLLDQILDKELLLQISHFKYSSPIENIKQDQHKYQGFIKIDIKDAFNSVSWEVLYEIAKKYGVERKVQQLYQPKMVAIDSIQYTVNKGIFLNQRSSKYLFNMLMEQIIQKIIKKYELNPQQIYRYVDDVLIGLEHRQVKGAYNILESFREAAFCVGLDLNEQKSGVFIDKEFTYLKYRFLVSCKQINTLSAKQRQSVIVQHHQYNNNKTICGQCVFCE